MGEGPAQALGGEPRPLMTFDINIWRFHGGWPRVGIDGHKPREPRGNLRAATKKRSKQVWERTREGRRLRRCGRPPLLHEKCDPVMVNNVYTPTPQK